MNSTVTNLLLRAIDDVIDNCDEDTSYRTFQILNLISDCLEKGDFEGLSCYENANEISSSGINRG